MSTATDRMALYETMAREQLALDESTTSAPIPCAACGSRQTVLRARFDLRGMPVLDCIACGKTFRLRLIEVRV